MKLSILNWKHLKKYILPSFMMFAFSQSIISNAANVTPVYLGKSSDYVDSDVPPAIKLNEAVDGLEKGTYLYRVQHKNLSYYTPVTPRKYRNTKYEPAVNKEKYRNWGPWEMAKNNVGFEAKSNKKYYNKVTIKAGTTVQGPSSTSANASVTIGTLSSAISVDVRAYTKFNSSGEYIYFSLKGTPFAGKNIENIGRVEFDRISTTEEPTKVFRSSSTLAKNFSYLGNYKDTTDSSHINLVKGQWKNSSNAPGGLDGKYGEWSYLGYNAKGEPLSNPYFPSDELHYKGCSEIKNYDWRSNPFTTKSAFDGDAYYSDRYELVKKLLDKGSLNYTGTSDAQKDADIKNYMKKFSFLTHPTKDTALVNGKRIANDQTRLFSVDNTPGDLYIANIDVYDGTTKVAYYSYDIKSGEATRKNGSNIVQGKTYRVEVKLGNGVERKILARKNQATIGITKECRYLDLSTLSTGELTGVKNEETSSNTIKSKVGSKSDAISFNVKAPTDAEVFDIYALVGENHDGTDNFNYENDAGFIRMYTKEANTSSTETVLKKANLKATGIELLDASTNEVVYSSSGSITNTAIVPRKSYKIRYTMKNIGDRPTIKTKTAGKENADGSWTPGKETTSYPTVQIPISYTNVLKVKGSDGSIMDVSTDGSNKKLTVDGSTDISLKANGVYSYTTGSIYFANPYLKSSFTIKATGIANSDTTDDTFSTTIKDLYDAVIKDVKIYPAYEYVSNGNRRVAYNVTYSAKMNAASHIKESGKISTLVKTKITVGDKSVDFNDMLIAKDGYQKFSHVVEDVLLRSDTVGVKAVVTLNYDRKAYETNYNNNSAESSSSVVKTVSSPFDGSNSDKASGVDKSDGSSLVGGGSLNNNCLIPRRANSWTVSHRKHTWTSSNKSYTLNGSSYSEPIYTTTGDSSSSSSYTESFKIKQILFKSKETEGKGRNRDGWIDLLDSSSSNRPNLDFIKVKAGFGFELKIVTEYRTNATKTQPVPSANTSYTGIISDKGINYTNELFVELPGTDTGNNQTRKILSTTGYSGTSKGLLVTEKDLSTDTEIIKEWTYTVKPSNTLGINNDVGKIFIPTGLKDGDYKISIYTPPISGVVSDGKKTYTSLCDRRDIYIEVSGSYTDDLNSNIIQ